MAEKKGNLSINSENMFPIIKKWLYSDHDIFYREVISNACDAITKVKKLDSMGDFALPEGYRPRVDVILNDKDKTVKISDNGIGMTAEEVEQYINQVAFSGATDFLEKYKDKDATDQIIGHFGLGFYSTFMVADRVDIDTLSYQEGAHPVHWTCDGSSEYEMEEGQGRTSFGTTITLHLSDDCLEFCNEYKAREVIQKYCSFMPYEIYLSKEQEDRTETVKESEKRDDDIVLEEIKPEKKEADKKPAGEEASSDTKDGEASKKEEEKKEEEKKYKIKRRPELLNEIHPLWMKTPQECTDEEYKEFYRKVFHDYKEPLFWIHLNMDYPFRLKGILYFPKLNIEFESAEGVIKLYNNQVFIADNIKEVIPEYLMLLKGVIDCPDLPLNVSRSALQNDGFVTKISDYISKKVADKLAGLCKTDRENYNKYWEDISPFIKYGCLKDDKFCEKMNDYILFRNLEGDYITLPDALKRSDEEKKTETAEGENGEKVEAEVVDEGTEKPDDAGNTEQQEDRKESEEKILYYVTDEKQQSQYINLFKEQHMEAYVLKHNIDVPFMQQLESKNEGVKFRRIDADLTAAFTSETSKEKEKEFEESATKIAEMMKKALGKDITVKVQKLKDPKVSSILTVSEESRRMQDMMKLYQLNGMNMGDFGAEGQTLYLNADHPLVQYVMGHLQEEVSGKLCQQLYDLAKLQNAPLSAEEMTAFLARSNELMMLTLPKTE